MDIFVLLFIVSFIALLVTLVAMSIRKRITFSKLINKGKGDFKEEVDESKKDLVSNVTTQWKETVPKHSTRIKLRASRKLRNKRKGHSKTVRGKKK